MRNFTLAISLFIAMLAFQTAHAKDFYVGSLTEMSNSFQSNRLDQIHVGTGATLGFNAYGIDVGSDILNMGQHRFSFATRLGKRFRHGNDWRIDFGLFTGPKVHLDPNENAAPSTISQQTKQALSSSGVDSDMIESQLNSQFQAEQNTISKLALGWNLAEAQLKLERRMLKRFVFGVSASAAYHVLLDGRDAVAFARNETINNLDGELGGAMQDPNIKTQLQNDVGARELSWSEMTGLNYRASVYLTIQL